MFFAIALNELKSNLKFLSPPPFFVLLLLLSVVSVDGIKNEIERGRAHLTQMAVFLLSCDQLPEGLRTGSKAAELISDQGHVLECGELEHCSLERWLVHAAEMDEDQATCFAAFLTPMLEMDPQRRASATKMLSHKLLRRLR